MSTPQIESPQYYSELEPRHPGDYFPQFSIPKSEEEDAQDIRCKERRGWFDIKSRCDHILDELPAMAVFLPNIREITHYLLVFPDMIDLLAPICGAVFERFPQPSQVALELFKDPESDDQYLTVYVRQMQYDEDILDILDDVSVPFDDILCDTSGWLLITTDFQDPLESNVI